jgi:hypothetical protein
LPELASGAQQSATIIEIRPYRGGWQCFEARGVEPLGIGDRAKEDAVGYAKDRAKFGRGQICVLNPDASVERIILFDGSGPKL